MAVSATLDVATASPAVGLAVRVIASIPPTVTPPDQRTRLQVVAIDSDSDPTSRAVLAAAIPRTQRWPAKNAPEELDLEIALDDPAFYELDPETVGCREVVVYRNGHVMFRGKPVTRRCDSTRRVWVITCKDPLWYLTGRNVGRIITPNLVVDGDFESGGSGWTSSGAVTFTIETDGPYSGTNYAKLVGTGTDGKIRKLFTHHSGPVGATLILTVWRRIVSMTAPAGFNLGVTFKRLGVPTNTPGAFDVVAFTSDTHRNVWEQVTLKITQPANVVEQIEIELWVGDGQNDFDMAFVPADEYLDFSVGPFGFDPTAIAVQVIGYAQGRGPYGALAPEKSDCNIGTSMASTSTRVRRHYPFVDRQKIYDGGAGSGVLDAFLQADDGFDIRCVFTDLTKTIKSYFPAYAPVYDGTDPEANFVQLKLIWRKFPTEPQRGASQGIVRWDYGDTIEGAANQVVERAGAGLSNNDAGYSNPSTLGGLTRELIEGAPIATPVNELVTLAAARGAQLENPLITPKFWLSEPRDPVTGAVTMQFIGLVRPGAVLPIDFVDGTLAFDGTVQVASCELDYDTDELLVTINP